MVINLGQLESHSQYMIDYQKYISKKPTEMPYKPKLNKDVVFKFRDGNRDKFIDMLKEALSQRAWNVRNKFMITIKETYGSSLTNSTITKL